MYMYYALQTSSHVVCFFSGGVRLTVKGNNLDIVSTAIMLLTLETKYPDGRVTRNSTNQVGLFYSDEITYISFSE